MNFGFFEILPLMEKACEGLEIETRLAKQKLNL